MAYTDNTKDNQAVQLLIEGEKIRVDSLGAASLGLYSGIIQFTLSIEARTDSAAAYVRVYDSGDLNDDCEVKLSTSSATITDNGGARTATSLTGYSVTGARRYTWLDTLTTPTGEWVIEVSTAANTGSTPLVFSRFHAEEASVIGDGTVTEDKLADDAVTTDKLADDAVTSDKIDEEAVLRSHIADPAGLAGVRYAAFGGGRAGNLAGAFASVTWDPSQSSSVSFVYNSPVAPSGTVTILGAVGANNWNLRFLATGPT